MKQNIYTTAVLGVCALVITAIGAGTALAAKPSSTNNSSVGNDISWPQCNTVYPTGQAFGIVGLNNGLANTTNPCFASELSWAQQSKGGTRQDLVALYVNTANPGLGGSFWPDSNTYQTITIGNPYGTCNHDDTPACAYIYGYAKAYDDATIRGVINPSNYLWWLDVETTNSWEANTTANAADLEGMTAYFQSIGGRVGIYSTSYQWGQIAGTVAPTSPLYNLKSWLAGASSLRNAQSNCALPPLTNGGVVSLTQYVANRLDYNYSCL